MARIRTIKPELFYSESLAQVSVETERSFIGLLTQADDEGRIKMTAGALNGALWSERSEHTRADMERDLDELVRIEVLCRYEVAGKPLHHVVNWHEHQRINRPSPSKVPPCPVHESAAGPGAAGKTASGQLPIGEG